MSTWNYGVSWSKLKAAMDCPRQLQYAVDKEAPTSVGPNYHMELGKLVQYVFELYFNQGFNLTEPGRRVEVPMKIAQKVLDAPSTQALPITYPHNLDYDNLRADVLHQVEKGFPTFEEAGILDKRVRAEVKWNGTFRNIRTFALIDFLVRSPDPKDKRIGIFDGKGHSQENADEGQVHYYGLTVGLTNQQMYGGLLYWRHGYREVDLSPKALQTFVKERLEPVLPIFSELKKGVTSLPATPSPSVCGRCNWKNTCKDSAYRRESTFDPQAPREVEFGVLPEKAQ